MEKFIKDTCTEFMQEIGNPLADSLAKVIAKVYNKGWENCKKFYHIDDNKFLAEQDNVKNLKINDDLEDNDSPI